MTRHVARAGRLDPYGLSEGWDDVAGRPVRTLSSGSSGDQPEVVFLPGLGAPGYLAPWAHQTARWTRATIVDLPGWRGGRARSCPPTLDGVAGALAGWLSATERRGVILIGHSTGAQAALRAALLAPERLAGLVLAGPTFDPDCRRVGALLRRTAATLIHEMPSEALAVTPSYVRSGIVGLLRFLRDGLGDRPEDAVGSVPVPLFVMTGQRDGFAPPQWAQLLARRASSDVRILPGAHNFCFPHPDLADAAVREFLTRRPAQDVSVAPAGAEVLPTLPPNPNSLPSGSR
ncbi:alpha/beta hydrolase [Jatrophihabitans telluris]|uniref:Alpha/beta hydrolase n=1 Tax=Jatrophihabitans telluris TaxID=2038343 RepID=A0ABY4QZC2_9ACTN|nr:alpha/beta hydrolase [Jatrophihabitans telluris]UQX88678.1 alpha/beta hydrolase [Jatrophihabitans telluris]